MSHRPVAGLLEEQRCLNVLRISLQGRKDDGREQQNLPQFFLFVHVFVLVFNY